MNMNQYINVWSGFAVNHIYKDMSEDALKAVDALMFLSPPDKDTFKQVFKFTLDIGIEGQEPYRSSLKIQKEVSYNFADFLMLKLIENFRRIYAIERNTISDQRSSYYRKRGLDLDNSELLDYEINPTKIGPLSDNKKSSLNALIIQQSNIYTIINKLEKLLNFKEDITFYPKSVVGKNYEMTIFEMGCYLGLHQSLKEKNVPIHQSIMETIDSKLKSDKIEEKNLKIFNKLYYPYKRRGFAQLFLNKFSPTHLVESHLDFKLDKSSHFYKITLIDLLGKKDNLKITHEQKDELLVDLFRNPFFKYFSPEEKINFESTLEILFTDNDYSQLFKKHILSPSKAGSPEYEFSMRKIKSSQDENLFLKSFYDNLSTAQRNQILDLFDFSDVKLLKRVVDTISEKTTKVKKLEQILPYFCNALDKDSLSYIVSKSADFFPIVQPYYLVEKLKDKLDNDLMPAKKLSNSPKKI